jgi:hypothetical protein
MSMTYKELETVSRTELEVLNKTIFPSLEVTDNFKDEYYFILLCNNILDWLEWAIENPDKVPNLSLEELNVLMSMMKSKDQSDKILGIELIKNKISKTNEYSI